MFVRHTIAAGLFVTTTALMAHADNPPAAAQPAVAADPDVKAKAVEVDAKLKKAELDKTAANDAKDAKQQELDSLRAGKLVRYGITGGIAVIGVSGSPLEGTDGAKQRSTEITTMPYLVLLPAYWFRAARGDLSAYYCASDFTGVEQVAAGGAAFGKAKEIARLKYTPEQLRKLDHGTDEERKAMAAQLDTDARAIWDPASPAKCMTTKLGFIFGKPLSYSADVEAKGGATSERREVSSTFAFGLAFVPNAYISVFAGVTHLRITVPAAAATADQPASPESSRRFVSAFFGLGGNLDLLGLLFK